MVGRWQSRCLLASMNVAGAILNVDAAVVRYGRLTAVDHLSLSVNARETLGLVGESGCGKTSLAKALVGLLPLASGTIRLEGVDMQRAHVAKRSWLPTRIQLLFQDPGASLSPRLNVRRLLEEPLRIRHKLTPASWQEIEKLMAELGLAAHILERYPHQLSGGQARRISIVRALAMRPRIIVADEPTAGLDLSVQGEMLNLLAQLQRELGLTYVLVSHNLNIIGRITNRVAVMYLGQIVEIGRTRQIFDRPAHHYTAALLAANPTLDPRRRQKRIVLKGELPSPLSPPSGCRFHTRCPAVQQICHVELPSLRPLANGHHVACHFPRETA
jgi:oligopeptide transport system ATP-binding protein